RIVSSDETKAIETAEILAEASGVPVEFVHAMHENDRSATGFLPPPQFEEASARISDVSIAFVSSLETMRRNCLAQLL
ncbi:hypothetical protein ACCS72_38835, partial [Rhizobium ruizarguesonis]